MPQSRSLLKAVPVGEIVTNAGPPVEKKFIQDRSPVTLPPVIIWRILIGLGGCTFAVGGMDVLASGCESVNFGGSRRSSTYQCAVAGDMPGWLAGIGMITIGILLLTLAVWPLLDRWRRAEPADSSGSATSGVTTRAQPAATWGSPAHSPRDDVADSLRQLRQLHEEGILTDDEYESKRKPLADRL